MSGATGQLPYLWHPLPFGGGVSIYRVLVLPLLGMAHARTAEFPVILKQVHDRFLNTADLKTGVTYGKPIWGVRVHRSVPPRPPFLVTEELFPRNLRRFPRSRCWLFASKVHICCTAKSKENLWLSHLFGIWVQFKVVTGTFSLSFTGWQFWMVTTSRWLRLYGPDS